ncbi:MAG: PrsW family glutamic-type intramembrane protease [Coriobacteriia bacterium]|nr:PrsW family glutamic-type intramembrane protease [Coriobacteriia bacterium]
MMYIENIFLLVATPLVACLFCVRGRPRLIAAALLAGMTCCLLSAYVNAFIAGIVGADEVRAAVEVAPVVEEVVKLFPLLFFLLLFAPTLEDVDLAFIFLAVGFATMESAFYLAGNGVDAPDVLALRGLSAAMMHLACGMMMAFGMTRVWPQMWLRITGTVGVLSLCIAYHGLYNLLIAAGGVVHTVALAVPLLTLVAILAARRRANPIAQHAE